MNRFHVNVLSIRQHERLHRVEFAFGEVSLWMVALTFLPNLKEGARVTVAVKPTHVMFSKTLHETISTANRVPATVAKIERGEILSSVHFHVADTMAESIVSSSVVEEMALKEGDEVVLFFGEGTLFVSEVEDA